MWSNEDYTNPKYVGTIWWIADYLKNPANPIFPLSSTPHHVSQLDADFFDAISGALDYCDKRVADRTRFGHRNMADHNLDSVLSANWAGAFLHHTEIDKQVTAEQATGWVDDSMYTPSTWPFIVDPQGCVVQEVKDDGSPKTRRTTDKWVTNRAMAQLPAVSLCTNIAIGKAGAIMEAGCSGPCATPNADENPEDGWLLDQAANFSSFKKHLSRCTQPESRRTHRPITRPTDSVGGRKPLKTGAGRCVRRDPGCVHRERCFLVEEKRFA